ncbi:heterodimeric geranylgeranyl pyrophosphate synthase small subunit, chloroplastic [Vigna radiata var. radiata]|uniref:Heterodimeric geranylgeranyl pyrophosphate synthase small subunit, chloroplastic n=1 Tax=Vigna radiata var. radiata TaxID=3916 RepID=A0A1S3UDB6_VIGRR|nr:heterodimeric geranylgeranyl pyrophosphate synthase small subunit, chloroplastic [Vigna radiata var. radiata]
MSGTIFLNANATFRVRFRAQARSTLPVKPTPLTLPTPYPHWASLQADIEAHLKQAIPIKEPLEVFEPMHRLVFDSPRTTVPALCLAACELVGGQRRQAMDAAAALLLNLANAHVHEELGLREGSNIALLTGDGIVPLGFELLASGDGPGRGSPERVMRVIIEISRAVGSEGLIDSQHMKKTLEGGNMKRVVEKGEGGLHACGAACGAVVGGGSEEEIERLRRFGFHVGMMRGMAQRGFHNHDVEEHRNLALNELQFFKDTDLRMISTFLNFY